MALVTSYKVSVYLNCGSDPIVFDDATVAGVGTSAYNAIFDGPEAHSFRIVNYDGNGKDIYVHEGSICYAEVEKTISTASVTDDVCPSDGESE